MVGILKTDRIETTTGKPVELSGMTPSKAYCMFTGSGSVVVNESVNISSLTDQATGKFRASFSNVMATNQFAWSGCAKESENTGNPIRFMTPQREVDSVSYIDLATISSSTLVDCLSNYLANVHGDLA